MLGAIAGDMVGSVYESRPIKTTHFPLFSADSRFTDDTVLTVAVADSILRDADVASALKSFGRRHPDAGYGESFYRWLVSEHSEPYNSWGNGAAMRVSPVGFAFASVDQVLVEAQRTAEVTHNHPEGVKGAQATALGIYLARTGATKDRIRWEIEQRFGYDLYHSLDDIRPGYRFDVSCQGSVPESIIAFLESHDVESAIRNAVSLGGDSDTMACIAGGIAQGFYGWIPEHIESGVRERLPKDLLVVVDAFNTTYGL
ncbi:MAG: ADP-ribosylglycohydrolase family protein [Gammaproteobacteria bacterium]|nr:ADP-ribosylglycohydrolase family protein [Gammaproteobacteria bacterium]NIR28447.1 ADP-ribosylglycohydrolase family protein [Gammaproteobacteria bacterium]NIR96893.1 ADP-ribosylglycohydrolase family protein [Gammaproteobacteria bacterium]NIT62594.1 ADP-ribosylglycohydrolase family protein [Gammaproteobacteria bacterium]NIV19551.1 ADP-ribosylglycohydrolase family protein [Gammaproteobacteria bacterium]